MLSVPPEIFQAIGVVLSLLLWGIGRPFLSTVSRSVLGAITVSTVMALAVFVPGIRWSAEPLPGGYGTVEPSGGTLPVRGFSDSSVAGISDSREDPVGVGVLTFADIRNAVRKTLREAGGSIDSRSIARHAIEADDIDTGSVTGRTIRDHSVSSRDLADRIEIGMLSADRISVDDDMSVGGYIRLSDAEVPSSTEGRLYNVGGMLYWSGILLSDSFSDVWSSDGVHAWRSTGNVGIGTTAPSQKLSVAGTVGILEGGSGAQYYTIFRGGDQNADVTYILPVASSNGLLRNTGGTLSWDTTTYLSSYTETDPVFVASAAHGITASNVSNWNTTYGWGNHASAGYLSASSYTAADVLAKMLTVDGSGSTLDADLLDGHDTSYFYPASNPNAYIADGNTGWDNSYGFIASYTETDPVFTASASHSITSTNVTNWNAAYGWGNHASAGYLSAASYTAADVLAKTLTVDGSGSTLDADLLDGHDTSYFQTALTNPVTGTGSSGHVPYWSSSSALTYDSDGNFYWDATNNRLAIGTTTTTQQLTLTGSIALPATTTSTTGVIYKGSNRFIHDYAASGTNGGNFFAGTNAGNFTMSGTGSNASYNTGVGAESLYSLSTGSDNTATGYGALRSNGSGSYNSAFGYNALYTNAGAWYNSAFGMNALYSASSGGANIAIGNNALQYDSTGGNNTAVGYSAGKGVAASSNIADNVFLGYQAGLAALTGADKNVLVGSGAGDHVTTGAGNIALGYQAGNNLTTGSSNILIGYDIDAPSATGSSQLSIGNLIFATGGFGTGTTAGTGNVGIGTASPSDKLTVNGNMSIAGNIVPAADNTYALGSSTRMWKDFYVGPGSIYVNGQKVLQTDLSDSVVVSADSAQNLVLKTTGGGNVEINPAVGGGQLLIKSNINLTGGKYFDTTDHTPVNFTYGIATNTLAGTGTLSLSSGGTGEDIILTPSGVGRVIAHGTLGLDASSYLNFGVTYGSSGYGLRDNAGVIEYRNASGIWTAFSDVSAADHGSFSGLLDDDHTQYALLAGRSGGQTLVGGSGVTDVLNLQGTSGNGTLTSPAVQILVGNNGATTALTALNNGNVGIGTTSPTYRLSVKNSGTATNAFEVLRSGGNQPIFRVYEDANGYGVARVLDVNGLDKIYLNSNGNSYLNGGNVGIGTTSPDAALTVFGQNANSVVNVSGLDNSTDFVSGVPLSLTVRNQSTTENTGSGIQFSGYNASSLENIFAKIVAIHTVKTVGSESGDIAFITRSAGTLSEKVRLTSSGNVGIGTTSPATLLDVYGSGGSGQYQLALTGAGSSYTQLRYNGSRSWQTGVGNTGETTLGVAGKYYVYDVNASAVRFVVDSSGNVGIGTTSPAQKLDIAAGNIRVDDTTYAAQNGVLYKGSSRFLHNFNYGNNGTVTTEGQNLFLGVNAGNFTMGSTATQTYHASYNTGIGLNALYSNTIGYYNSAFGVEALFSNTTGYQNSAVGRGSLNSNTTGYYNSALGVNALYLNNTGYQNSALGRNAGRYLTDGSTGNTTGNNSLFLGYDTRAHADGETNQIVIGASAIGLGSNTVVLGNDSITTTALKGNVGIGTTSPSYKLVVNGGDFDVTSGVIRKSGTVIVKSSGTETMIGPGGNGSITFHNSGTMTSGDEKIRMDSSGNLGIGTTSPANLLDVYTNNVGGQGIRLSSALKNPLGELIYDSGAFGIYGYNTTNLFTKTNSSLVFGANNAEVMRIAATGNVGIGTTTPSYLLSLGGTAARTFGMERNTTAATAGQGLTLTSGGAYTGGTDLAGGDLALKSGIATGTGSSAIHFYTSTAAGASGTGDNTQTEKMTILGNGNVGIGTTSPLYSLDVSGAIRSNPSNGEGFIVTNDNIGRDLFVGKASLGVVMGYAGTAAMIQGSNNVLGTTPDLSLQPYGGSVSIGTTTPIRALTVAGGGEMSIIKSAGGMAYFNVSDSRGNNSGALTMRGLGSGGSAGLPLSSFTVDATESYLTGSVAVGFASSPVAKLDVHATGELVNFEHDGGSTSGNYVTFKVGGTQIGSIANSGGWSGIAYNTTSDRRLKEHIVDTGTGLDTLLQIPVRDFDFIADPSHVTQQGFIAQELYDVYPYAVTTNGDDGTGKLSASASPWGVDYGRLTPLLVRSIQELHGEQTSVRQTLEGRLSELGRVTEGNISDLSSRQSLSTAQLDVIGESLASLESEDVRQAERLAAIDARMLSVEDSVSGLAIASDRFDGRLSAIEGELSLLRDQNAVLFDFYQTFGIGNAVMKDAEGNVDLLEGTLSAATVKAGGLEIATHESDTPTAGSGTIVPVGEGDGNDSDGRTVRIETKAVRKGSLIYVTPVGSTHGAVLYVDDIESGEGFTVATDDPVRETVDFNWIVVGTGSR